MRTAQTENTPGNVLGLIVSTSRECRTASRNIFFKRCTVVCMAIIGAGLACAPSTTENQNPLSDASSQPTQFALEKGPSIQCSYDGVLPTALPLNLMIHSPRVWENQVVRVRGHLLSEADGVWLYVDKSRVREVPFDGGVRNRGKLHEPVVLLAMVLESSISEGAAYRGDEARHSEYNLMRTACTSRDVVVEGLWFGGSISEVSKDFMRAKMNVYRVWGATPE